MSRVAYLILAHADPQQLHRLIHRLDHKADFYIHIDAKSSIDPFLASVIESEGSLEFIEERVPIFWAGYSMITATLNLIRSCLHSGKEYKKIVLLSGMDYPIESKYTIYQRLVSDDALHLKVINAWTQGGQGRNRIVKWWFFEPPAWYPIRYMFPFRCIRKILHLLQKLPWNRRYPFDVIPYWGSQWWVLSPEVLSYVLDFFDEHDDWVSYYKRTFAPDEHLIHTILGNSHFRDRLQVLGGVQYYPLDAMSNIHLVHEDLTHVYTEADYESVITSGKLFVRKVMSKDSKSLCDALDERIDRIEDRELTT